MAKQTTTVSHAPGSHYFMTRGRSVLLAWNASGRVGLGLWKTRPKPRAGAKEHLDGQEMHLSPEEALDLAYAIGFMAHELDPDAKKKHRSWMARGRRRAPVLKVIRGGAGRS